MRTLPGNRLDYVAQREALSRFVHRFTREHKPEWAAKPWKDGLPYPVQFASDADWLANSTFTVRADGRLARNVKHCQSDPTWPDNPEFRR